MSLINDVLRDLDRRRYQSAESDGAMFDRMDAKDAIPSRNTTGKINILLSAGLILCAAALLRPAQAPILAGFTSDVLPLPDYVASHHTPISDINVAESTEAVDYPTKLVLASFLDTNEISDAVADSTREMPLPVNSSIRVQDHTNSAIDDTRVKVPVTNDLSSDLSIQYTTEKANSPLSSVANDMARRAQFDQRPRQVKTEHAIPWGQFAETKDPIKPLSGNVLPDETKAGSRLAPFSTSRRISAPDARTVKVRDEQNHLELTPAVDEQKAQKRAATPLQTKSVVVAPDNSFIEVTPRPLTREQEQRNEFLVATRAYKQGDLDEAERLLKDLISVDSTQHKARLLLVRLYAEQGRGTQAEMILSNALLHFPGHVSYASSYAQMLAGRGRDNAALDVLKNTLPEFSENADLHGLMAGLYQRTADASAAVASYMKAVQLDPTRGEWWMGLGISSEQIGDKETAKIAYLEAMELSLAKKLKQFVALRLRQLSTQ